MDRFNVRASNPMPVPPVHHSVGTHESILHVPYASKIIRASHLSQGIWHQPHCRRLDYIGDYGISMPHEGGCMYTCKARHLTDNDIRLRRQCTSLRRSKRTEDNFKVTARHATWQRRRVLSLPCKLACLLAATSCMGTPHGSYCSRLHAPACTHGQQRSSNHAAPNLDPTADAEPPTRLAAPRDCKCVLSAAHLPQVHATLGVRAV